jgi:hypothetical protein
MCGDLEEEESATRQDEVLYARFVAHARALLTHTPPPHESPVDTPRYMEKLFTDALSRAVKDCEQMEQDRRYERLIVQPVVFARLAGFLAAHMSLREDPLRRVMEAMMLGYSEAETLDRERGYGHGDVPSRT